MRLVPLRPVQLPQCLRCNARIRTTVWCEHCLLPAPTVDRPAVRMVRAAADAEFWDIVAPEQVVDPDRTVSLPRCPDCRHVIDACRCRPAATGSLAKGAAIGLAITVAFCVLIELVVVVAAR